MKKQIFTVLMLAIVLSVSMLTGCSREASTRPKELTHIDTSGTFKTSYVVGDTFDTTGLVVTAYYDNDTSKIVSNYTIDNRVLEFAEFDWIEITFTENNITKTVSVSITVTAPFGISIADENYIWGMLFRFTVELNNTLINSIRFHSTSANYPYTNISSTCSYVHRWRYGYTVIHPLNNNLFTDDTFTFYNLGYRINDIHRIEIHGYIDSIPFKSMFYGGLYIYGD